MIITICNVSIIGNLYYIFIITGPLNQALYRTLGVTAEMPYFVRNGQKIFTFYDAPHLLKSVRNNFRNYDLSYSEFGKGTEGKTLKVSWSHVTSFYALDKIERFRSAPKLTDLHIHGKGLESMKVKLASQIFSNAVAAGLSVYARGGYINSQALHTADFIGNMNDLFDSVNSSTRFAEKELASAVAEGTNHVIFWKKCVEWIKSWKFHKKINQEPEKPAIQRIKVVKPVCQKGWVLTISAFLGLWEELKSIFFFINQASKPGCT